MVKNQERMKLLVVSLKEANFKQPLHIYELFSVNEIKLKMGSN